MSGGVMDASRAGSSRREYLRSVVRTAQRTGGATPWQSLGGARAHFATDGELLAGLHHEWLRLLVGRLHRGRIVSQRTPAEVSELYAELCVDHPTLRAILDTHASDPALDELTRREHAMLARVAGMAGEDSAPAQAAAAGRGLVPQPLRSSSRMNGVEPG